MTLYSTKQLEASTAGSFVEALIALLVGIAVVIQTLHFLLNPQNLTISTFTTIPAIPTFIAVIISYYHLLIRICLQIFTIFYKSLTPFTTSRDIIDTSFEKQKKNDKELL